MAVSRAGRRGSSKTRWVDVDKGDHDRHDVRSRLVAKEIAVHKNDEFFRATPPLEALFGLLSEVASSPCRGTENEVKVMALDANTARLHAAAGRERASSPHGPLRLGASGVTERTRRGSPIGFAVNGGGGGASHKGRLPRRLGGRATNANASRASRRLMPEKCGGVDAVAGSSRVPGQSNWTTRP